MNIRAMREDDLTLIRKIHAQFYEHEFKMPEFDKKFLCCFVTTDDDGHMISMGGVRLIPEAIIITDKNQSVRNRREALFNILAATTYVCEKEGFNSLHAFVQEEVWEHHLKKVGFEPTKGNCLVMNF